MARSLLIGCPVGALEATANDLNLMGGVLADRGFACEAVCGDGATRAGILSHCERLNNEVEEGEPVVIYYSGHGCLAPNPCFRGGEDRQAEAPLLPLLVPMDIGQSTRDDFRGILELELRAILAKLATKTDNLTVILDCCHAAGVLRNSIFQPKAIEPWALGLETHLKRLADRTAGGASGDVHAKTIRLFATTADCQAYEYTSRRHGKVSLFTEVLCQALRVDRETAMDWRAVMQFVSDRVRHQRANQRPYAAGPVRRLLFENEELQTQHRRSFFFNSILPGIAPALRGGRLHGLEVGDVFGLVPPEAREGAPYLGRVRITAIEGNVSELEVLERKGRLLPGLDAVPLERGLTRLPVRSHRPTRALRKALADSLFVYWQAADRDQALAQVLCRDGRFLIQDDRGAPLAPEQNTASATVAQLGQLARVHHLLNLRGGKGEDALAVDHGLSWGFVTDGRRNPCPLSGSRMHVGDALYVDFENRGTEVRYLHLLNIDLDRRISLLTGFHPCGVLIYGGEPRTLGWDASTGKCSWRLGWGASPVLDPSTTPDEHLVAVIADQPVDLQSLAHAGPQRDFAPSDLAQRICRIYHGQRRATATARLRYDVIHIHFNLSARTRPTEVSA